MSQDFGPDEWLMAGDWFQDADRALYIVPLPDVTAECYGPDNATMDAINAACRDHERLTDADATAMGLDRLPDFLKRYDACGIGYYSA